MHSLSIPSLKDSDLSGKTVLLRLDLNVPMRAGKVRDNTRILRALPSLQHLVKQKAKIILLSHLGRPKGFDPALSMAPLLDALSELLPETPIKFSPDCIGNSAKQAVSNLNTGEVLLMENLRFHEEETRGDEAFAKALASLGDFYVNDAFSCSHRAHASISGIPAFLPSAAGFLLEEEVFALTQVLSTPKRPLIAIVGGSKISTKLALLGNLTQKVDKLVIGGAMANTFLKAQGYQLGGSLLEENMLDTARHILAKAAQDACEIILPTDAVVAHDLTPHAACEITPIGEIPEGGKILDIGPESYVELHHHICKSQSLVWNGPVGAYETTPFDNSTTMIARLVAARSRAGALHSVAGGGDTLAALSNAGLGAGLSYLSTAGGAFLEWLEGKELPGILALAQQHAGINDANTISASA